MTMHKWIQDAIKPENKGSFKKKASRAGESTMEYAKEKKDSPGKIGKQARLAITLSKMRKK